MKKPTVDMSFKETVQQHGLELVRDDLQAVQVNVGLICDLACRHCHLDAGPRRTEVMTRETMDQVVELVQRARPAIVDITGGAPEMVPDLGYFLARLDGRCQQIMLRSNLTALGSVDRKELLERCVAQRIVIVASFPSLNVGQADSQRGRGVYERSIEMLLHLNDLGYGRAGSGLELNLVANPAGAFLPADQAAQERRYKQDLLRRWGVVFNRLFVFANVPLGRFRTWLEASGNYDAYLERLREHFNPASLPGLMCRNIVSVSWDGRLYDCDFNLAAEIGRGGRNEHVSGVETVSWEGEQIAVGDHCFACTAGSGFT